MVHSALILRKKENNKWHLCNELQADAYFWATCPIGTGNKSLNLVKSKYDSCLFSVESFSKKG